MFRIVYHSVCDFMGEFLCSEANLVNIRVLTAIIVLTAIMLLTEMLKVIYEGLWSVKS